MKNIFKESVEKIWKILTDIPMPAFDFLPTDDLEDHQKLVDRLYNLERDSRIRATNFPFKAFWKKPIIKSEYKK